MNSKRSTEILVGLFVAAGMAALFVLAMKVSNLGDITDEKAMKLLLTFRISVV